MRKVRVEEIAEQMLAELYRKAKPPASWKQLKKKYAGTRIRFFELHYLPQEECERILDKYKKKVDRIWESSLSMAWLDFAPTSCPYSKEEGREKKVL